jgi:hypothetical protein
MDAGHAQAALESKEGAERAIEDFRNGVNANPFSSHDGQRWGAYRSQMQFSINRRDCIAAGHDRTLCCWEHDHHIQRWNRSHRGIKSCPACEVEAEVVRAKREVLGND